MAWRTATGEDGPELFERSGPEPTAQPSAATGMGPEATPRPSETNRRSHARMKEASKGDCCGQRNQEPVGHLKGYTQAN